MSSAKRKVHNAPDAHDAKVELRRRVLSIVKPAHVLDAFCGPDGAMWSGAWREAASYAGCDAEYKWGDPRRRFIGDTYTVLRSIDLQAFNVFDVDTFGCPWTAMLIISARRRWSPGEFGAAVITDGASMDTRFNGMQSPAFAEAAGLDRGRMPGSLGLTCSLIWKYGLPIPTFHTEIEPIPSQYRRDVRALELKTEAVS